MPMPLCPVTLCTVSHVGLSNCLLLMLSTLCQMSLVLAIPSVTYSNSQITNNNPLICTYNHNLCSWSPPSHWLGLPVFRECCSVELHVEDPRKPKVYDDWNISSLIYMVQCTLRYYRTALLLWQNTCKYTACNNDVHSRMSLTLSCIACGISFLFWLITCIKLCTAEAKGKPLNISALLVFLQSKRKCFHITRAIFKMITAKRKPLFARKPWINSMLLLHSLDAIGVNSLEFTPLCFHCLKEHQLW